MFGKVKRWLGIEGVKLELILPDEAEREQHEISGRIRFYSMNAQTVRKIRVRLVEKYTRGRLKHRRIDEYKLGEIALEQDIEVPAHEHIEIDFTLPFHLATSEMDDMADKNVLLRGVVGTAKFIKGVKSVYRVEAEAEVKGTALHPFATKEIGLV